MKGQDRLQEAKQAYDDYRKAVIKRSNQKRQEKLLAVMKEKIGHLSRSEKVTFSTYAFYQIWEKP